jgi:hypothetical protein
MRTLHLLVVPAVVLGLAACPKKKDDAGTTTGSADLTTKPVETSIAAPAMACPPGNVVKDGACVVVVTAEKVQVVVQQQSRLDELSKLLDNVEVVAGPIELLNAFRQLPEWKSLSATSEELRVVEQVVATLDASVKKLREFKAGLGEASARLGNLKGELDRLMTDQQVAKTIDEVRTRISAELRTTLEPLAANVSDTIQNALTPLAEQLGEWSDLIITACTIAKRTGGGAKVKDLCGQAKDIFGKANTFLADLKTRPAKLYDEVSTKLEAELEALVDAESKKLLDAAQEKVNAALKLPPAGAGSAGPAASGSGSAAKP